MFNCNLYNNDAYSNINLNNNSHAYIFGSTFYNTTQVNISSDYLSDYELIKTLIHDNNTGEVLLLQDGAKLRNVTIYDNNASYSAISSNGNGQIENTIIWGNNGPSLSFSAFSEQQYPLVISYSNIEGGEEDVFIPWPQYTDLSLLHWEDNNINSSIFGRAKHLYSIHNKMKLRNIIVRIVDKK